MSYIDNKQDIWFRGKDIAKILGNVDTDQAIRKFVGAEFEYKKYFPVESTGKLKAIGRPPVSLNEAGIYALVFNSQLKEAKKYSHPLENMASANCLTILIKTCLK